MNIFLTLSYSYLKQQIKPNVRLDNNMKTVRTTISVAIILYVLFCMGLYIGQDYIIFNADTLPENYQFRKGEEVEIEVAPDLSLNNLLLKQSGPSKGAILYLHGNKGNNRRCIRQAEMLEGLGYDIMIPDYRGYGKSDGKIESEGQLLSDVQAVYNHLKKSYDETNIIVVGYSLGTGMASYLAAHNSPSQLLLIAPYISFYDLKDRYIKLVPDFLVKYPLNNQKYLADVKCPIHLFHGTTDEVIPYDSSIFLSKVNPLINLITLNGTGHRGSIFHHLVRDELKNSIYR